MSTSRNPRILESTPEHEPPGFSSVLRLSSTYQTILLAGFVGVFSYLAAKLGGALVLRPQMIWGRNTNAPRSEEHTSELQSRGHLVCRLLLEKKKDHTHTLNHMNIYLYRQHHIV